jgi:hypothetical protein
MFYSYTGGEYKNMFVRFSIHQINAPNSCFYLSKFCCIKETWGYVKVIHKQNIIKREEKRVEIKMDTKVSKILDTWMPT